MKLVPYIIINKLNLQYDDDYVVEGQIGLIKAVDSFDNKKTVKFSTYASTCIRNQILMYLRKTKSHDNICSIYENIATDEVGNGLTIEETLYDSEYDILEDYLSNETKEEISHLLSFLTEKELMIIQLYYGIGGNYKTQKEIALLLGISQSYLSRMIKKYKS